MKSATLFSGFEGVGVGMRAAGLEHAWGIEYDDKIAAVARMNGFNTLTLNILDADPALFEKVDVLHASPPCPSFSAVKTNGHETELDISLAMKTADFIEVIRPKYFTLENVYAYRNSQSWAIISNRLYTCGYWLDFEHINFADYGVPQTRQRMLVRAVHNGFVPYLPKKETWIGWYSVSSKHMDKLHLFHPTKRIIDSLPKSIPNLSLLNTKDTGFEKRTVSFRAEEQPSFTITVEHGTSGIVIFQDDVYYKTTDRIQACLQSFPENYLLPQGTRLACKGIGNAVPPRGMEKVYKGLLT